MSTKKVGVIGCGHLGRAIVRGLLDSGFASPDEIIASARTSETVARITQELGVEACRDNQHCLESSQIIVFTATPAAFQRISHDLTCTPTRDKVVLSAIGGVSFPVIAGKLKTANIIRFMPTIAVAQREGPIVWMAQPSAAPRARSDAQEMLGCLGTLTEVGDERLVDLSSMLSSCALAYYYLLCNAIAEQGPRLGFTEHDAEAITRLGFLASAFHLKNQEGGANDAVAAIATRSGVTEAALNAFRHCGLEEIVAKAIDAARDRLVSFSKMVGHSPFSDDDV